MPTKKEALRAYATMINTLDPSKIEPFLPKDFHYASQMVFAEITSKQEFMRFIAAKLSNYRAFGCRVWAEMGWLTEDYPFGPCVILAEEDKDNLVGTALATVERRTLLRLDLCIVPSPQAAKRTGEYPGLLATPTTG